MSPSLMTLLSSETCLTLEGQRSTQGHGKHGTSKHDQTKTKKKNARVQAAHTILVFVSSQQDLHITTHAHMAPVKLPRQAPN